ncbi:low molecular weight protein-tyrosine-phosphatase [Gemmatimonadota bacterium]
MSEKFSVLFVCHGNICRSPMAEGVFRHLVAEAGLSDSILVDSAATADLDVGDPPDLRATQTAEAHGVDLTGTARQVGPADLRDFTHVLAMDRGNLEDLERLREGAGGDAVLCLLREFDPEGGPGAEVPDPYYGGPQDFEEVFQMVKRSGEQLLQQLLRDLPSSPG